jgi:hypothetical protein
MLPVPGGRGRPAGRIHFSGLRDAGANSISKATRNSPRARAVARNRSPLFLAFLRGCGDVRELVAVSAKRAVLVASDFAEKSFRAMRHTPIEKIIF